MNESRDGRRRPRRRSVEPPRLAEWFLRRMLPDDVGESVGGDLAEIFESRIVPGAGRFRACAWYWRQVFFSLRLLLRFRGNPKYALESWKGRIRPENPRAGAVYHQGIHIDRIPVQGVMGLLFVFATLFIFGLGIPAVRTLGAIAGVLGVAGSAFLYYWHRNHAPKIRCLNLHGSASSRDPKDPPDRPAAGR